MQHENGANSNQLWRLRLMRGDPSQALPINYLGCWRDQASDRALGKVVATKNETWGGAADAVRKCSRLAVSKRKSLFAMQAGNECWVGDDENQAKKHRQEPSGCTSADDQGHNMGAGLMNALYRIPDRAPIVIRMPLHCGCPSGMRIRGGGGQDGVGAHPDEGQCSTSGATSVRHC